MIWDARFGPCTLFLLPTSASSNFGWRVRCHRLLPCITQQYYVNRISAYNVREINGTVKREEVVDIFIEGKSNSFP